MIMAALVNRIFSATSMTVRCNFNCGATFIRQLTCISSSHIETSNSLPSLQIKPLHLLISKHPPLKQHYHSSSAKSPDKLQFYRALSSEATCHEDDTNVYYDGLVKRIDNGDIQLIDVREASELAEFGQITHSLHIPLGELADSLRLPEDKFEMKYHKPQPKETDNNIVFHCRSGVRSLNAVNIAKELGYSKARHFPGGWLQWAEKNNLPSA